MPRTSAIQWPYCHGRFARWRRLWTEAQESARNHEPGSIAAFSAGQRFLQLMEVLLDFGKQENLVRYHGVLANRSRHRPLLPRPPASPRDDGPAATPPTAASSALLGRAPPPRPRHRRYRLQQVQRPHGRSRLHHRPSRRPAEPPTPPPAKPARDRPARYPLLRRTRLRGGRQLRRPALPRRRLRLSRRSRSRAALTARGRGSGRMTPLPPAPRHRLRPPPDRAATSGTRTRRRLPSRRPRHHLAHARPHARRALPSLTDNPPLDQPIHCLIP